MARANRNCQEEDRKAESWRKLDISSALCFSFLIKMLYLSGKALKTTFGIELLVHVLSSIHCRIFIISSSCVAKPSSSESFYFSVLQGFPQVA